jgi:hypothetical protein
MEPELLSPTDVSLDPHGLRLHPDEGNGGD